MNHPRMYAQLWARLAVMVPGLKAMIKTDGPWWMKAVTWVLVNVARMKDFVGSFTTTIGRTIFWSTRVAAEVGTAYPPWETTAHEGVHAIDDRATWHYKLSYLFPLPLFLLTTLAFLAIPLSSWWLLNLGWLLALAPWPAPGRVHWERRGYTMSTICNILQYGEGYVSSPKYLEWYASHFTGGDYWFMVWRKATAMKYAKADVAFALRITRQEVTVEPFTVLCETLRTAQ